MAKRRYKKSRRHGKSAWGMLKGAMYVGAIAAPMYLGYQQLGGGINGAAGVMRSAAFVDPATNKFSMAHGAQIWTPVAAVAIVDLVSSKIGVQRRISQGVSRLMR